MMFEKKSPLNILMCPVCGGTGYKGWHRCFRCVGASLGTYTRGQWLFWHFPLTKYSLALARARQIFNKIRLVTVFLLGINFWLWAAFLVYKAGVYENPISYISRSLSSADSHALGSIFVLFWFGVVAFSYLWYRSVHEKELIGTVEHYNYESSPQLNNHEINDWGDIHKIPHRLRHNIKNAFTNEALGAVSRGFAAAVKHRHTEFTPLHIFYGLLSFNKISNIFTRLGIPVASVQRELSELLNKVPASATELEPAVGADVHQILFGAYEEAYESHQEYVSVPEMLIATVRQSPALQELLYDLNVEKQKLINVVEWVRIRERLYRQYLKFRQAARHRSKKGIDRAMTAVATSYLNRFSEDVTMLAQFGHTDACVARDREIEEIFRIVEGGQQNVMLVGDFGVGKRSIVEGIAERMVAEDVPRRLGDKRLVRLSISSLLAGTSPSGAVERLIAIMHEISRAGNIILFIHNIHELIGVSAGANGGESLDVAGTLADFLNNGRFFTIATTTSDAYAHHVTNSKLSTVFTKVDVAEMDENQAIQVVESRVGYIEYKQKVFFAYEAVAKAVQLSKRYLHDTCLPGSALEIVTEAATFVRNKKGVSNLVTAEDVATVVAQKTKIPVTTVSANETTKLLNLETAMHTRVIGQDEAVNLVANSLRRARADIRATTRPIANFLFLGPTGVGKTELAKTIAEVYFGGEDRMVRLDMSEYQDKASISRLIGTAGSKGSGILTETIRRNPFALLLLDEIEKADKDVLNLFLQVMDDGRLTDSTGRVVDFTNVILIATSNAGTSYVSEQIKSGLSTDAIKDRLLHGELKDYFRPEFLNRFDGIVLFKPLSQEDIKQIAALMLKRVSKDLDVKGITFRAEPAALDFLASVGFDPEFGARPMRRALEDRVENKLAELILSGKLRRRDTIVMDGGGELRIS